MYTSGTEKMRAKRDRAGFGGRHSCVWVLMVAVGIWGIVGPPSVAAEGKRVAFVVGINTYDSLAKDQQLENAVSDAREISRTLKHVGFEVIEGLDVKILDFDKKWQAVLETMTSEDTLVFFFSGHGVEVDGENLLLPRDIPYFEFGRHKQFQRKAISVSELMKDLQTGDRQHPKVTIMILDACRENPTIPPQYRTKGGKPQGGLARAPKTRGTFMMYAAEPGKVSLDRLGPADKDPNSVYTRSLLPLLKQTNLSIQDLAIKVKERVFTLTEKVGYEQLPEYTDGLIGQFCLPGCAVLPERRPGEPKESSSDPIDHELLSAVSKRGPFLGMTVVPLAQAYRGSNYTVLVWPLVVRNGRILDNDIAGVTLKKATDGSYRTLRDWSPSSRNRLGIESQLGGSDYVIRNRGAGATLQNLGPRFKTLWDRFHAALRSGASEDAGRAATEMSRLFTLEEAALSPGVTNLLISAYVLGPNALEYVSTRSKGMIAEVEFLIKDPESRKVTFEAELHDVEGDLWVFR
jgi:hypothetical protein